MNRSAKKQKNKGKSDSESESEKQEKNIEDKNRIKLRARKSGHSIRQHGERRNEQNRTLKLDRRRKNHFKQPSAGWGLGGVTTAEKKASTADSFLSFSVYLETHFSFTPRSMPFTQTKIVHYTEKLSICFTFEVLLERDSYKILLFSGAKIGTLT